MDIGNISNNSPDYSRCTIEELEDVLVNIDLAQYPERHLAAKAMISKKLKEQKIAPKSRYDQVSASASKPKWSEQLLMTRIIIGSFLFMTFSALPAMFYEFMTTKSWTAYSSGVIWMLASILVVMWFTCLKKDSKLMRRLGTNWRGKLAVVVMPFLFLLMSWLFINKSLPLYLHMVSVQQEVRYDMDYRKRSGRKHCRHRVEIIETDELADGDLCLTESQRNSLSEKGKITVVGTRSQFGMVINGFKLTLIKHTQ
ncbi:hypothetical protein [Aliiglaciecola sp. LCG003]|uniref:hypothetical protein n=1 Tax=Aliiglaciecola sp. LCG003 TaxID=3053655 RepID=UPI002573102C|nr:hypothetical protein [Aliiglaciecola sp. LCG003]WJG10696.1 hypothetical protein QR722_06545 [Aliiglaciecola sp. LCG003]